ncbi:MAG: Sec-independent protein translocase protein TatB [Candidatus Devosia phytovorans]|uniref:Sec-independent protein translocase protein TatB n=1 Tax=Candidatus Devosia phytovorans TaxID=3121372 RepID=A0AAJ5VZN3_9HYPH|nr:Sec-independent protein translocase protein TatB [Devosia sp.]WEK06332.1 MAG: Sec-independent protein translocase protein TatB [Devosia sp.]
MLGLGWTEMLVIGVVALIVIGPKDLPVVMNRVGKIVGQIRRMGSEFQREINKTTGLDEVRNLRNSITAPLKKTSDEIRREFNAMTPTGPKPSGLIKPTDPSKESVVDAIKAQAGMTPVKPVVTEAPATPAMPVKAATRPKAPARAKAAPTKPVAAAKLPPIEAVPAPAETKPVAKPARKPRTPKVTNPEPKPALPTEPADSPATKTPKARAPRKPAVKKPATPAKEV